MNEIRHLKINTDNPEELIKFYFNISGIKILKRALESGKWELYVNENNNGAGEPKRQTGPMIEVSDMDMALDKVEQNGGKVVTSVTFKDQPGVVSYCKDPESNTFSLYQKDANWD